MRTSLFTAGAVAIAAALTLAGPAQPSSSRRLSGTPEPGNPLGRRHGRAFVEADVPGHPRHVRLQRGDCTAVRGPGPSGAATARRGKRAAMGASLNGMHTT